MNNKTVLVVGGAGYIGAHMVRGLLDAGYDVVVLDNFSRGHRDLVPAVPLVEGDLGDTRLLDEVFSRYPVDAVMHFAAYSLVAESVARPLEYYRNNVSRTIDLLAAMSRHRIRRFIFSSTAAVYGEPSVAGAMREDHPMCPTNPYGATKLAVERLLADCAAAGTLNFVSLRYFNAAGADASGELGERHDPETHLIPLALQVALGMRERLQIFGTDYPTTDGTCIRDYVHVTDLAQAHLLALESLLGGGANAVYNLGNSKGYSVREVIEVARQVSGRAIPTAPAERRAGDPAVLIADSQKIRQELGWRPRYEDLKTIVETAWLWHRREAERAGGAAGPLV